MLVSYLRSVRGKNVFDRLMIRLPVLKGFVRDLETTRIFRTIQVLVENGVHLATALKIGSGVATNREYKRVLSRATEALKEGREVGKKLRSERLLPDLATDLLSIGEESGRVGEVCGQIADHYEYELRTQGQEDNRPRRAAFYPAHCRGCRLGGDLHAVGYSQHQ